MKKNPYEKHFNADIEEVIDSRTITYEQLAEYFHLPISDVCVLFFCDVFRAKKRRKKEGREEEKREKIEREKEWREEVKEEKRKK